MQIKNKFGFEHQVRRPRVQVFLAGDSQSRSLRDALESDDEFEVCCEATNRVETSSTIKECHPNLVILDRDLPPKDGFEAADEVKGAMPEVPVFLLAKQPDLETEKEAFSHGIAAVFEKDDELNSVVANAHAVCGPAMRPSDTITAHQ